METFKVVPVSSSGNSMFRVVPIISPKTHGTFKSTLSLPKDSLGARFGVKPIPRLTSVPSQPTSSQPKPSYVILPRRPESNISVVHINANTLIDKVRVRNELWDRRLSRKANQLYVQAAWQEISEEMGYPVSILRKKWKNLRDQFGVELAKPYRSRWERFESMSFLNGFVKPRRKREPLEDPLALDPLASCPDVDPVDIKDEEFDPAKFVPVNIMRTSTTTTTTTTVTSGPDGGPALRMIRTKFVPILPKSSGPTAETTTTTITVSLQSDHDGVDSDVELERKKPRLDDFKHKYNSDSSCDPEVLVKIENDPELCVDDSIQNPTPINFTTNAAVSSLNKIVPQGLPGTPRLSREDLLKMVLDPIAVDPLAVNEPAEDPLAYGPDDIPIRPNAEERFNPAKLRIATIFPSSTAATTTTVVCERHIETKGHNSTTNIRKVYPPHLSKCPVPGLPLILKQNPVFNNTSIYKQFDRNSNMNGVNQRLNTSSKMKIYTEDQLRGFSVSSKPSKTKNAANIAEYIAVEENVAQNPKDMSSKTTLSKRDDTEDEDFFWCLLPHVKKIPSCEKLRFRNKLLELVEGFAYPKAHMGPKDL